MPLIAANTYLIQVFTDLNLPLDTSCVIHAPSPITAIINITTRITNIMSSNNSNALQISIIYNLKTAPHQPQRITMLVRESWIRAISCCVFHGYARTNIPIIIDYSKIFLLFVL